MEPHFLLGAKRLTCLQYCAAVGECVTAIGFTAMVDNLVSDFNWTSYVTGTRM